MRTHSQTFIYLCGRQPNGKVTAVRAQLRSTFSPYTYTAFPYASRLLLLAEPHEKCERARYETSGSTIRYSLLAL